MLKDKFDSGELIETPELYIDIANMAQDMVNDTFPPFMNSAFNCAYADGSLIKCAREIVASSALFIKKKRYACLMIDKEGHRYDVNGEVGKIKAMGLDLKRSDTPPVVQKFLSKILKMVLCDANKETIYQEVKKFKQDFLDLPPWQKGAPSRVNGITVKVKQEREHGKTNMPGHVRASMNWNDFVIAYHDTRSTLIIDGTKVVVCKLKPSHYRIKSIAFPVDQTYIPEWFSSLPFDDDSMICSIVDKKVENLLSILNWNISKNTDIFYDNDD